MIKDILKKINNTQQIIIYISITAFIGLAIWRIDNAPVKEHKPTNYNLHTEIPRGYNLYALEIDNFESINAIVDDFALVNLYQVHDNKRSQLALQKVKLIRSPKDPRYFAVLATNTELELLTSFPGPFKVALQNPNSPNKNIVKKNIIKKRIIVLEEN